MTLTRYGIREWGTGGFAALLLIVAGCRLAFCGWPRTGGGIAAAAFILWVLLAAFFRSPSRRIPPDAAAVTAPADGVVRDIETVADFNMPPFEGKALRIGIFLSVLNVHVNRSPAAFSVAGKFYRKGEYLDARHPECGRRNEAMTLAGTGRAGAEEFPLAVRQISGAIARRIVCPVEPGRELAKGEVYGMIKFGSRTELYLPAEGFDVRVKVGDPVRGGETVLATVRGRQGKNGETI